MVPVTMLLWELKWTCETNPSYLGHVIINCFLCTLSHKYTTNRDFFLNIHPFVTFNNDECNVFLMIYSSYWYEGKHVDNILYNFNSICLFCLLGCIYHVLCKHISMAQSIIVLILVLKVKDGILTTKPQKRCRSLTAGPQLNASRST